MRDRGEYTDHIPAGRDSVMLVYIQSYRDCVPKGTFITLPYGEQYKFCGLDQMLLKMEDIMDTVSGPESAFRHRYLYQEPFVFQKTGYPVTVLKPGMPTHMPGSKATFTIQVCYRQHGSMQGRLTAQVDEKYEKISFRSSLELMRMLHEYLHKEAGCLAKGAGN